jgi:CMP-N-acetylneuraminic acid synthetase
MNIFALIPARGGSKGVARKNIRPLADKPLIGWTIETAIESGCFHRVIVSTEDGEIAAVARHFGAETPFMRPAKLAHDSTPGMEVILHAIEWLGQNENDHSDCLMLLQPTSPLRSTEDICRAIDLMHAKDADAILSVTPVHHHPYWTKTITPDGRLADFMTTDRLHITRQTLPPVYALNGAIYLARCRVLLEQRTFDTKRAFAYVMPPERSLDIDTPWDFRLAELIIKEQLP